MIMHYEDKENVIGGTYNRKYLILP